MGVKIQTIKDIRSCLSVELQGIYPETEINALTNVIIKTLSLAKKLYQIYDPRLTLDAVSISRVTEIIQELKEGRPIQYILGSTDFYNCIIRVREGTLIPRQETEELVDLIIRENRGYKGNILDIGTGSGCIAIALAKNIPGASAAGIDISRDAIAIARENASLNNVSVKFTLQDIFNPKELLKTKPGIIVSNPPYIRISEKVSMNRNVIGFEPPEALFVNDSDPLVYYKAILEMAGRILQKDGRVYFEINEESGKEMVSLMESYRYTGISLIKDINGKDRIIKGKTDD